MSAFLPRLMFITSQEVLGHDYVERVRRALWSVPAGSVLLQLREPTWSAKMLVEQGDLLVRIAHDAGQRVVINDRLDLARYLGADGVHLPSQGLAVTDARRLWPDGLIGRSCHNESEIAEAQGADYITISPLFVTPSKPDHQGLGLDLITEASRRFAVYGLGGVNATNAEHVFASGAHGVAMMRAAWL